MFDEVQQMIDYVHSHFEKERVAAPMILGVLETHGPEATEGACSDLLDWLQLRSRLGKTQPLDLSRRTPSSAALRELISRSSALSNVFKLLPDSLDYGPSVTGDMRRQLEQYVESHYRPYVCD